MGQCQMLHQSCHGSSLRAVLFHKLQPRGGVVKQVADGDGSALGSAFLLHHAGYAALQMECRAAAGGLLAGQNIHPADSGNGSQCLTAKTQRADLAQIGGRAHLAGGMAQKGLRQLRRRDAAAVIRHADKAHATPANLHHHGGGSGVDGVFHQFLHHAGRPLHHLAGGDQVGHMGRKLFNMGHPVHLRLKSEFTEAWRPAEWSPWKESSSGKSCGPYSPCRRRTPWTAWCR